MTHINTAVDNGVNVEALLGAREALTEAPEAAAFKWRANCKWVKGTHSRSTVQQFFGLGENQSPSTSTNSRERQARKDATTRQTRSIAGRSTSASRLSDPTAPTRHSCGISTTCIRNPSTIGRRGRWRVGDGLRAAEIVRLVDTPDRSQERKRRA